VNTVIFIGFLRSKAKKLEALDHEPCFGGIASTKDL
jgi:hypothetical protein